MEKCRECGKPKKHCSCKKDNESNNPYLSLYNMDGMQLEIEHEKPEVNDYNYNPDSDC